MHQIILDLFINRDCRNLINIKSLMNKNEVAIIEHESARLFLRRIAGSGQISKINVINEKTDSTGKHSYINVQEIRKPKL